MDPTQSESKKEKLSEEFAKFKNNIDTVAYHGGCPDGFTAFIVAQQYYKKQFGLDIVGVPCAYEREAPDFTGKSVLFVDFAFGLEDMKKIAETAKSYFVLDHHLSALRELGDFPFCFFDVERSGAMLAWDFFYPGTQAPPLVAYVQDADLFQWKLPNSKEFTAALETFQHAPQLWNDLLDNPSTMDTVIEMGKGIYSYKQSIVSSALRFADSASWSPLPNCEPLPVAISVVTVYVNDIGKALYDMKEHEVAVLWRRNHKSGVYRFFLRSETVDTSVIAKHFGGGGHRNASGFYWKGTFEEFEKSTGLTFSNKREVPSANDK